MAGQKTPEHLMSLRVVHPPPPSDDHLHAYLGDDGRERDGLSMSLSPGKAEQANQRPPTSVFIIIIIPLIKSLILYSIKIVCQENGDLAPFHFSSLDCWKSQELADSTKRGGVLPN